MNEYPWWEEFRTNYSYAQPIAIGAGRSAAVLIVDFIRGFTDPESPLSERFHEEVKKSSELVQIARERKIPVIFTTVEYEPGETAHILLSRKSQRISILRRGSRWTEIDPLLQPLEQDLTIRKKFGSAFFATPLFPFLFQKSIDTLLICGCMTSGCVRATVTDAIQYGIRPLVICDAVGDRSKLAHETNLMDIELRYGDVVPLFKAKSIIMDMKGNTDTISTP